MTLRQTIALNAVASLIALVAYTGAVLIFAVWESSDFGRPQRSGNGFEFAYFALYFFYVACYLGLAVALTIEGSIALRVAAGMGVAVCVAPVGFIAFWVGFFLGVLLFFFPGFLFLLAGEGGAFFAALMAVPVTGAAVGATVNATLAGVARWNFRDGAWAELKHRNVVTMAACAGVAGLFACAYGLGNPAPLGRTRFAQDLFAGLVGPAIHAGGAVALAVRQRIEDWRLGRQAARAALVLLAVIFAMLAGGITVTSSRSGGQLWTFAGLAQVFATTEEVEQRRRPAADQPIRLGGYVVDRRPADLKEGNYDWKSRTYYRAAFALDSVVEAGRSIPVQLDLTGPNKLGLGYLCDAPLEGALAPCKVTHNSSDPQAIRVGLYQGNAEIGQAGRRFLISCRYSTSICMVEFIGDWYPGLHVALIFDRSERAAWEAIVRDAQPQIERIIRPVSGLR